LDMAKTATFPHEVKNLHNNRIRSAQIVEAEKDANKTFAIDVQLMLRAQLRVVIDECEYVWV